MTDVQAKLAWAVVIGFWTWVVWATWSSGAAIAEAERVCAPGPFIEFGRNGETICGRGSDLYIAAPSQASASER